ncbi:hypothetical protein AMJ85_09325 [candidate division BRC1 bacterium SM23_51]|nr:MAG: hypothetical protein AMJ85_09325 [candidate division BRC1 bacterium SM23_51]
MALSKRYPNRLGIKGWAFGGRWGIERYMYTLHRITGLGLLFYFLLHILVTATRAFGQDAWEAAMATVSNPLLRFGEFLVFAAFAIHAANGIRLVLIELGWAVGPAEEPVYPYRSSLNKQRPLMVILMIVAAVAIVLGGYDFTFQLFHPESLTH